MKNKKRKPNWEEDYANGKHKEELIGNKLRVEVLPEKPYPVFIDIKLGNLNLEIKADTVSSYTGNLFLEHYSNIETKRLGGPFSASEHGVDLMLYFSPKPKGWNKLEDRIFIFKPEDLIDFIEIHSFKPKYVKNERHTTMGYAIPIKDLLEVALDVVTFKDLTPDHLTTAIRTNQ